MIWKGVWGSFFSVSLVEFSSHSENFGEANSETYSSSCFEIKTVLGFLSQLAEKALNCSSTWPRVVETSKVF